MTWIRAVVVIIISFHLYISGTEQSCGQQLECLYQALQLYGIFTNGVKANFTELCYGLCNLDEWKSNGKDTVALKVNFSNCFTELSTTTSTTKNADITITCNLQVSENCNYTCNGNLNTQLSTMIQTPVSTFLMENLTTSLRTSTVSNFVDTTINRISSLQTPGVSKSVSTTENGSTTLQTSEVSNFVNTTINSSMMCTDTTTERFQDIKPSASSPGAFVGAVFGGAVLGAVITAVVFVIFLEKITVVRKSLMKNGIKNPVYQPEDLQLEDRKPTLAQRTENYNEIIDPSHDPNPSLQRPDNSTDDVYNHLNEPAQIEISDNYEHARPPNAAENGYGLVTIERMSNDNYCAVDVASSSDSALSRGGESNHYYTLQPQED